MRFRSMRFALDLLSSGSKLHMSHMFSKTDSVHLLINRKVSELGKEKKSDHLL